MLKIWIAYVLRHLLSNQFKKHSGRISPNCFVMLYYFNFHFCSYLKKNICISCPTSLNCVPETPEWVEGIMGGRGEGADEVSRWFPALLGPTPRPTPSPWASCDLTAPLGPGLFQAASLLSQDAFASPFHRHPAWMGPHLRKKRTDGDRVSDNVSINIRISVTS